MTASRPDLRNETQVPDLRGLEPALRRTERAIAHAARGQQGAISLKQLDGLGLGPRGASHRAQAGRLDRVHRGVYTVGSPTRRARWAGAVLAVGSGAVLSHDSAAELWGLSRRDGELVHVTLPGARTRRRHRAIQVHSGTSLADADISVHEGIACTAVPRTLLDCASALGHRGLERAIDRAEELRVFDLSALEELLARSRGRRGAGLLGTVLAEYASPTMTRSVVEERFLKILRRRHLPIPEVNSWIPLDGGGYRPDFLWRDQGLVVEVDGRTYHARQRAFRHDRVRDRRLALAGFETRRYAASEVIDEPARVAAEMAKFLSKAASR